MLSTLYNAVCASLLQVDFTERINVCCLCLETLEDSGVSIYDEVMLQIPKHPRPESTTVAHIINYLMDQSVSDVMFMLKSVCKKCMEAAINCFKFIQCCKDNAKVISGILDNLEESCDNMSHDIIDYFNSVYVVVETNDNEPENCLVKRYYDKNRQLVPQDTAFMRFKQIIENNIDNVLEMQSENSENIDNTPKMDALDESLREIMCCKKNVSTEELLYDPLKPLELKCRVCHEIFPFNTSLRIHFFKVHRSKVKCKKCSPPEDHRDLIKIEIQTVNDHDDSGGDNWQDETDSILNKPTVVESQDTASALQKKTIIEILENIPEPTTTGPDGIKRHGIYSCKKCKQTFSTRNRYISHITKKQYTCKHPPRGFGEFVCDHCGYSTCYKYYLSRHIRLKHLGEKRFICERCGQNFFTQYALKKHNVVTHTKEDHISCEICGRKCASKSLLTRHMRVHTGEKPYPCRICSRSFARAYDLEKHVKHQHNPVSNFKCNFCDRAFIMKRDKERHEARHLVFGQVNKIVQTQAGVELYSCPDCEKFFKLKTQLEDHVNRIHNPVYRFKCDFCDSKFKVKRDKVVHEARHLRQESPVNRKLPKQAGEQVLHPCPNCSKCFKRECDLTDHVKRIHNPTFDYKCNFCSRRFKFKRDKIRHEARHLDPYSLINKRMLKEQLGNQNQILQQ